MSHEAVTLRNGKCAGVFETCGETSIIAERLPRPQAEGCNAAPRTHDI